MSSSFLWWGGRETSTTMKSASGIYMKFLVILVSLSWFYLSMECLKNYRSFDLFHFDHKHIGLTSYTRSHGHKSHLLVRHMLKQYTSSSSSSSSSNNNDNNEESTQVQKTRLIQMANFFNKMYVGSLAIGTPAQTFGHVVFDTGSADLWVLSGDDNSTVPKEDFLKYFVRNASDSYWGPIGEWQIEYGIGSASGYYGKDSVSLTSTVLNTDSTSDSSSSSSSDTTEALTIQDHVFAEAMDVEDMYISENEPQDGVCGFARSNASTIEGAKTLMENLYSQGLNPSGLFSFYLTKNGEKGSQLILGEETSSYYVEEFYWLPVATEYGYSVKGLWAIEVKSVSVNYKGVSAKHLKHRKVSLSFSSQQFGIFDTGTSYIGVPEEFWSTLMSDIVKYRSDCSESSDGTYVCTDTMNPTRNLPSFLFSAVTTEGTEVEFELYPSDYIDSEGTVGFMSVSTTLWIFGDTFLTTYFTTYNDNKSVVGLGRSSYVHKWLPSLTRTIIVIVSCVAMLLLGLALMRCWVSKKAKAPQDVLLDNSL